MLPLEAFKLKVGDHIRAVDPVLLLIYCTLCMIVIYITETCFDFAPQDKPGRLFQRWGGREGSQVAQQELSLLCLQE